MLVATVKWFEQRGLRKLLEDFHHKTYFVERFGNLSDHEVGHVGVDGAGELDEAGAEVEFLCLPGKIKGIDWNAVAAEAGAGVKGLEAKGLGFGGFDDFVDVNAHAHAKLLELVDERDIDAAIDVLKQLGHLGHRRAADRDYAAKDGSVKRASQVQKPQDRNRR